MHLSARLPTVGRIGRRQAGELLLGESELALGHADGEAHGGLHVGGVGLVAAGNIEGGAVIDGGADDGQAERNVDAAFESR